MSVPFLISLVIISELEERADKIDLVVEDATLQAEFRQLAPLGEKYAKLL